MSKHRKIERNKKYVRYKELFAFVVQEQLNGNYTVTTKSILSNLLHSISEGKWKEPKFDHSTSFDRWLHDNLPGVRELCYCEDIHSLCWSVLSNAEVRFSLSDQAGHNFGSLNPPMTSQLRQMLNKKAPEELLRQIGYRYAKRQITERSRN